MTQVTRRAQISDEVEGHIRANVLSGKLKPGKYVRIDGLARELGVSATPVREALQRLRREGLVHLDPYRGFRVIPVTREDLHDIFWVQETISTELARRAATRMTTDTIDLLEEIQDKVRAAADSEDLNQVGSLNNEFHRIINRTADSPKLGWLLAMTVRYTPPRLLAEVPEWTKVSDADHQKLIAGFRAGDAEKVADEMSKHIRNSDRTLGRHMEAQHFWDSQEEITVATDQPVP